MGAAFGKTARQILQATINSTDGLLGNDDGLRVDLFQNNVEPSPQFEWSDYVLADFLGYAPATVGDNEFLASPDSDGGNSSYDVGNVVFTADNGLSTPQLVYGYAIATLSTAPQLIAAVAFNEPINVALPNQVVTFIPCISLPPEMARHSEIDN